MMSKGALHIHSFYSDGEWSLAQLRELYLHDGCRFACVTDHAEAFDAARLHAYVAECARLSDASFLFVPGLEFSCTDRMHIVGYGVTTLTREVAPVQVMEHISACGGVSVIAHPKGAHFASIEQFSRLPDGLEVWNSKYDGRYAPRPATFRLLQRLQARRPDLRAFYGQDLHWQRQYRGLFVQLDAEVRDRASILEALRRGAFRGYKDGVWLPSDGAIPEALMSEMERAHRRSDQMRRLLKIVKRAADRLGLRLPSAVKAQARRVM
jgi:hypothetical protein